MTLGKSGPNMTGKSHNSRTPFSSERMGEHTRPRVWFATPRREHWGKTFNAGARRIVREARALPFELKPKPALSRRNSAKMGAARRRISLWKRTIRFNPGLCQYSGPVSVSVRSRIRLKNVHPFPTDGNVTANYGPSIVHKSISAQVGMV